MDRTGFPFELVPFGGWHFLPFPGGLKNISATRPLEPIVLGIRFLDPTFRHIKKTNSKKTRCFLSTVRFFVTELIRCFFCCRFVETKKINIHCSKEKTHGHLRSPLPRNCRHCFFWMFLGIMVAHKLFILLMVQKSQTTTWDGAKAL